MSLKSTDRHHACMYREICRDRAPLCIHEHQTGRSQIESFAAKKFRGRHLVSVGPVCFTCTLTADASYIHRFCSIEHELISKQPVIGGNVKFSRRHPTSSAIVHEFGREKCLKLNGGHTCDVVNVRGLWVLYMLLYITSTYTCKSQLCKSVWTIRLIRRLVSSSSDACVRCVRACMYQPPPNWPWTCIIDCDMTRLSN